MCVEGNINDENEISNQNRCSGLLSPGIFNTTNGEGRPLPVVRTSTSRATQPGQALRGVALPLEDRQNSLPDAFSLPQLSSFQNLRH